MGQNRGAIRSLRGALIAWQAGLAVWLGAAAASADPVADFYKDKRINLLIGVNFGGGYDLEARLVARFIGRHIPGNPTIVPQNMVGAGGITMANYLHKVAPRDGTAMGMYPNTLLAVQVVGGDKVEYDTGQLNWLGTLTTSPLTLTVWHKSGVNTFAELRTREITVAAAARGAITYTFPALIREVTGAKLKIVMGYQGASQMVIAMERGEVDAMVNSWSSWKSLQSHWIRDGLIRILVQSDPRSPELAQVPSMSDLAKTEDDRLLINLVLAGDQLGKPIAATPGVPAERVAALRAAYAKMLKDPEFVQAAEAAKVELEPVLGDKLESIVKRVLATPRAIAERAKTIVQ